MTYAGDIVEFDETLFGEEKGQRIAYMRPKWGKIPLALVRSEELREFLTSYNNLNKEDEFNYMEVLIDDEILILVIRTFDEESLGEYTIYMEDGDDDFRSLCDIVRRNLEIYVE